MCFDVTKSIAEAFGGAVGGGLVVVLVQALSSRWRDPRVIIEIQNEPPYVVDTDVVVQYGDVANGLPSSKVSIARYIRVLVRNSGISTAKQCRVYVTKLEREDLDGTAITIIRDEAIPLPWSFGGDGESTVLNISRKFARHCDVVAASDLFPGGLAFQMQPMPSRVPAKCVPGKYRVTISVTGDNFDPTSKTFRIEYQGSDHLGLHVIS